MHWLILIPYYFVGSLTALPFLLVIARLCRLPLSINTLVGSAIALSLAGIITPLACDWVDLVSFTGRPMLVLVVLSFLLAGLDGVLAPRLPLPLDAELENL